MVTPRERLVEQHQNLTEYFRDQVVRATSKFSIDLASHSEYYLVNLLHEFRLTEQLFEAVGETLEDVPLAMLLERAVHGDDLPTKIRLFKQLGDRALFVAGCFPQRTQRSVNHTYYITMGSGAYQSLSSLFHTQDAFAEVFTELGDKFPACVEVISEVHRAGHHGTHENLLELYERWLHTGSKQLAKILAREGIPVHAAKPSRQ